MTLPAVVQHVHVLEASGLVRSEKVGRVRTWRIVPERRIAATYGTASRLDALGALLERRPTGA